MNRVVIDLKKGFRIKSYIFGYSTTNNVQSVNNWQDGNNVFDIQNDGRYYFFSRHKNSSKVSVLEKIVNCGGSNIPCQITFLKPYTIAQPPQNPCTISWLAPYFIAPNTGGDAYETDWSDGTAGGDACLISFLSPYQNPVISDSFETDWSDGVANGNNCQITYLTPYFN